jgi:hypothetical protein
MLAAMPERKIVQTGWLPEPLRNGLTPLRQRARQSASHQRERDYSAPQIGVGPMGCSHDPMISASTGFDLLRTAPAYHCRSSASSRSVQQDSESRRPAPGSLPQASRNARRAYRS